MDSSTRYSNITQDDLKTLSEFFQSNDEGDKRGRSEDGQADDLESSKKKPLYSGRGRTVTDVRQSALHKTRESSKLWGENLPAIIQQFNTAGGNRGTVPYIQAKGYRATKMYFYYLLETLHLQGIINIRLREIEDNHPLEFVILDKDRCVGKFDIFFVKKNDFLMHHPGEVVKQKDEFSNMKCTADKLWKVDLSWFITSDAFIPEIIAAMHPSVKNISNTNLDKINEKVFFPYPFCFTDVDAPLRVFKFIILPPNVQRTIGSLLHPSIYKRQLHLMKKFTPEIFQDGPPIDALAEGVSSFHSQRAQTSSQFDPYSWLL